MEHKMEHDVEHGMEHEMEHGMEHEMEHKTTNQELIRMAIEGLKYSYSPYSGFCVSAALLTVDGEVYTGCNIENAGYTPTNCAERTAIFKAVSEGRRSFQRIAIVGGKNGQITDFCPPCGVCRQVMMEFCNPDSFEIILARTPEDYQIFTLQELMPMGFGPASLIP